MEHLYSEKIVLAQAQKEKKGEWKSSKKESPLCFPGYARGQFLFCQKKKGGGDAGLLHREEKERSGAI